MGNTLKVKPVSNTIQCTILTALRYTDTKNFLFGGQISKYQPRKFKVNNVEIEYSGYKHVEEFLSWRNPLDRDVDIAVSSIYVIMLLDIK